MGRPTSAAARRPAPFADLATRARRSALLLARSRSVRRRVAMRCVALVAAGLFCLYVARTRADALEAQRSWGRATVGLRAHVEVAPGTPLSAEDLEAVEAPAHLVPPGLIEDLPPGAVLAESLSVGEFLTRAHLSGERGAPIPPDSLAVRLEPAVPPPRLEVGDTVEVVSATDPAGGSTVLRREAVVLVPPDGDDPTLEVAVRRSDAMAVTRAALTGGLAILRPSE